tara:strand:+ start:337 stop:882 length:546 start_codon:yes stop_codon:yes gene_type:complete
MKQLGDKLTDCPCCKGNACYESEFTTEEGPITTWLCMTCGFTSNTTMTEDSEVLKTTLELTAELIKDLRQDHGGLVWLPTAITMPEKGMIFPEPIKQLKQELIKEGDKNYIKTTTEWGWTVVKAIPIPEEEQHKFPDPRNPGTNYKNKMDMKNLKRYGKLEFMDAAEELGMFTKPVEVNED